MKRTVFLCLLVVGCIERPEGSHNYSATGAPAERTTERAPTRLERVPLGDALMTTRPTPQHVVGAQFEGIDLIGYDMTPDPAVRGDMATITLYFAATADLKDDWQIFIHLDDLGRTAPRTIGDHYPAGGKAHTSGWRKGDIIRDVFPLQMPTEAVGLEFFMGFYQGEDRLTLVSPGRGVNDGANRLKIGTITLR